MMALPPLLCKGSSVSDDADHADCNNDSLCKDSSMGDDTNA